MNSPIGCQHCGKHHPVELRFCPQSGKLIAPERFFPKGMIIEGKYRLGDLLGEGGMGLVFEASHVLLDKKVAIKLLLPQLSQDQEMRERMMQEARIASSSGHRNIVAVTDVGRTQEDAIYLVMEHLSGVSLEELIKREAPLAVPRAAGLAMQILAGLEAVHRQGVVHRDLKPSNVIVTRDSDGAEEIKILDFGISKRDGEDAALGLTTVGKVLGTPLFMAPEQARGERQIDQRVDIYACAAILYALLTGQPPNQAPNLNALIARILEAQIAPPSDLVVSVPAALDALVLRGLARERERRFALAREFRLALQPFASMAATAPVLQPKRKAEEQTVELGDEALSSTMPPVGLSAQATPLAHAQTVGLAPGLLSSEPSAVESGSPAGGLLQEDNGAAGSPLELARRPRAGQQERAGTLYAGPSLWRKKAWPLVGLILLLIAAGLGWQQRGRIVELVAQLQGRASVLLLVETQPRSADVYIDGVLQVTQPVALPQTAQTYKVRVEADGYLTRVMQVDGRRSRTLRVVLERQQKPTPRSLR